MNLPTSRLDSLVATESPLKDFEAIIRSNTPLIAVESNEEPQIVRLVREISRKFHITAFRWTVTEGLRAFDPAQQPRELVQSLPDLLGYIQHSARFSLFVLLDCHPYLEEKTQIRQLKDIALTHSAHQSTVIMVGHSLLVPEELRPFTASFRMPLPTADELRWIVGDVAGDWGARHGQQDVKTTNKALDLLVRNLAGLTETDARRLALKAISDDGCISELDIPEIMRAKYELLGRDQMLSFEYETVKVADLGGMQRLRHWLEVRKSSFLGEGMARLDPPRGMLLLGVQGCGKSLAAKAAAAILGVPLLRFDFGALYNKYYGETERNLRQALETAEVMSPCVLWMDEIEKGIAVQEGDDGLSRRVLGTVLTWMSERKKPVFLVATANDISRLPPELVRKGRFDEIFFVDLPSATNRRAIFGIHFKKRSLDAAQFDLDRLVLAAEGFSGAEIEQAVVSTLYTCHAQGRAPASADLLAQIEQTKPLSVVMAEQVTALREWAKSRTVFCD